MAAIPAKASDKMVENPTRSGDADPTVPYQHSVDLHKKLVELGVKTEFITVEGGLHGKFEKDKNSEISKKITNFLLDLGLGSK